MRNFIVCLPFLFNILQKDKNKKPGPVQRSEVICDPSVSMKTVFSKETGAQEHAFATCLWMHQDDGQWLRADSVSGGTATVSSRPPLLQPMICPLGGVQRCVLWEDRGR